MDTLVQSQHFDEVRVLTRSAAHHTFPAGVVVKEVDYASQPSLEAALRGVDGVVSAFAFEVIGQQRTLVDAAAAAGVRRLIPSEYGNDTMNPKLATMPIYQPKIAIREQCQRLALAAAADDKRGPEHGFSWTVVMNASFLGPDWTLDFLVDMTHRKCTIKDGGDVLFCAATYADIARAVLGIFCHPDETRNRPVKISSIDTTQNELLALAREVDAEANAEADASAAERPAWDISYANTEDLEREGRARWAAGDESFEVQSMMINRAFLGPGWGGFFPEKDNELLGVQGLDRSALKDMIREALQKKK